MDQPVAPEKKSNTILIIIIVVVVLLVLCCCCIIGGLLAMGPQLKSIMEEVQREIGSLTPALLSRAA